MCGYVCVHICLGSQICCVYAVHPPSVGVYLQGDGGGGIVEENVLSVKCPCYICVSIPLSPTAMSIFGQGNNFGKYHVSLSRMSDTNKDGRHVFSSLGCTKMKQKYPIAAVLCW